MFHLASIQQASTNPALLSELDAFFGELDLRIADHQPVCRNRGACCKFDAFGHKLYVTTLELAFFRAHHADRLRPEDSPSEPQHRSAAALGLLDRNTNDSGSGSGQSCPFQDNGLCTTREGRPLGCRVFFCESADEGWQSELTEWALARLREMHERFDIPYAYSEWLAALARMTDLVNET
jgi:Fe-S-cluster containining protein